MKFLLNTTSSRYQSGFASIGNFLTQLILSPLSESALHNAAIDIIQSAFSEAYQMPTVNLEQLRHIFCTYLHPEDQQVLWVAPLGKLLNKSQSPNIETNSLSIDEMSVLCEKLYLSLQFLDSNFNETHERFRGYQGNAPLGTVEAVYTNEQWQAITNNLSDAYRQQLLWKQGLRQITDLHVQAIKLAVKAVLSFPMKRFTSPLLVKTLSRFDYEALAELCRQQAEHQNPDNGFYDVIDIAISHKEIATLLTIYYFKPNTRNYVLHTALAMHSTAFVQDFIKYYHAIPCSVIEPQDWLNTLHNAVPDIVKKTGDSSLQKAIYYKTYDRANKLILEGSDIYQANMNKVSPLHPC